MLKAMLRRAAQTEGKDLDKLIPFLLFAHREVPQASTGFSPFELLYGRAVRGPLDVLRESWEAAKKSEDSVVSYILLLREKLEKISQLARSNLQSAQRTQKEWYDWSARERSFQEGEQVLIVLPTPIVPVKKRDGSLRICVGYRRLNQISVSDAWHPMPVAVKDRPKTAFATPFGLYQFNMMPFGLKGAPATFQRLIDHVIHGLNCAAAYLDDLIIFSESWETHLTHLRMVLERLHQAGLTAKARKCEFAATECVYLGHIVGSGAVKPEKDKTVTVRQFPTSETKEVHSFLGLAGYYR